MKNVNRVLFTGSDNNEWQHIAKTRSVHKIVINVTNYNKYSTVMNKRQNKVFCVYTCMKDEEFAVKETADNE